MESLSTILFSVRKNPLAGHPKMTTCGDSVSFKCDVEGLCHTYRSNLYRNVRFLDYPRNNQKCLLPCTALSVVKILEECPGCYDEEETSRPKTRGKDCNRDQPKLRLSVVPWLRCWPTTEPKSTRSTLIVYTCSEVAAFNPVPTPPQNLACER